MHIHVNMSGLGKHFDKAQAIGKKLHVLLLHIYDVSVIYLHP